MSNKEDIRVTIKTLGETGETPIEIVVATNFDTVDEKMVKEVLKECMYQACNKLIFLGASELIKGKQ